MTMNLNLVYLFIIRIIAIGGQSLALFVMQRYFHISVPLLPVAIIIASLTIFTAASWWHLRGREIRSDLTFLIQLMADVIALTLLVYFTGGSSNPFISLFILPIIFAAASMKAAYTGLITLVAVGCYTFLMFFHVPVEEAHSHDSNVQLHVWGMWYGFILSALLVAFFVARIARSLRQRELALAKAREEAMQANQLAALGTLAAGTAHELGTPLSTVAVLCKELEYELSGDENLSRDLKLIRKQIDRCKQILANMASDAGQLQADAGRPVTVDDYMQGLMDDWKHLRPDIDITVNWKGSSPAPAIIADRTLSQAIINVLNNAADASVTKVEVDGRWTDESLCIKVHDDGPGLDPKSEERIGKAIYSSKTMENGMGIGLLLAQATLNRLGGSIRISNRRDQGVHARIDLPLDTLLATN